MFEIELELEAPVIEKFTCDIFLRFSVRFLNISPVVFLYAIIS